MTTGYTKLTLADLEAFRQQKPACSGDKLRYYCPIHGSDNQRSLVVYLDTGRWQCFACGSWGYLSELKKGLPPQKTTINNTVEDDWLADAERQLAAQLRQSKSVIAPQLDYADVLAKMQQALPDSLGASYLEQRGIPLEVAQAYGVGYAEPNVWPGRKWELGRVVFPHQTPSGEIINLYGRAVGYDEKVRKDLKHDHLRGQKGVFNAAALSAETVYICEAAFDAMSLIASGYPNACAIYGVSLRLDWVQARRIVFCLDNDDTGQREWQSLAWEADVTKGIEVFYLPKEVYHGYKDLNEVLINRGTIDLGEWIIQDEQDVTASMPKEVDQDKADLIALGRKWVDHTAYRILARHDLSENKMMIVKKDLKLMQYYQGILQAFDVALTVEDSSVLELVIRELDVFRASL